MIPGVALARRFVALEPSCACKDLWFDKLTTNVTGSIRRWRNAQPFRSA